MSRFAMSGPAASAIDSVVEDVEKPRNTLTMTHFDSVRIAKSFATKGRLNASILGVVLVILCTNGRKSQAAESIDFPNVILIYTDDQGYGDASCLNPESKFQTPNLDRLATEGMSFTDAHSSDTVCTPSRYGLLTGRYAWRTTLKRGVYGSEIKCLIADGRMTIASLLRDNGYATAMVGKWHLGMEFPGERGNRDWTMPVTDMPLDKGFEYFYGVPASLNYGILAWFEGRLAKVPPTQYTRKKPNRIALSDYRITPPYEDQPVDLGTTNEWGVVNGPLEVAPDFVDSQCLTRFTDNAIDWIERQLVNDKHRPFFLYLPYTSPHKPVIPIDRFRGRSRAGAYGDFMMETDSHVGRILDLLDRARIAENTIVIFTSDNGPENTWKARSKKFDHQSNGIYREGKRSIYEGGHRVPMFIRWPAKVDPLSVCSTPVCQTDILATLAAIVGTNVPENAGEDSISFLSELTQPSEKSTPRAPVIHHSSRGRFAIRDGDWKLVMESNGRTKRELYNLRSDPSESVNVIDQQRERSNRMATELTKIIKQGRTSSGPPQPNDTPWWDDLVWMSRF